MDFILVPILAVQVAHFVCARREAKRIQVAALARNPEEYKYLLQVDVIQ